MMKGSTCFAAAALAAVLPAASFAQVPQLINYQGRIVVGGTNFDGTGQFKFALVSGDGATTHWSNDGSSAGGGEPIAAVELAVSKGLYSVLLGDATLTNMTAIPPAVFTNSDVRLRAWFNDGVHGWQQLSPDQRIAAVGYAMMADNIRDAAITSAKLAAGAVGSTHIAAGAVGSVQIAAGAVGSQQLAANAVQAGNIATGAITSVQLAKPPQSGLIPSSLLALDFGPFDFAVAFNPLFATTPNVTVSLETSSSTLGTGSRVFVKSRSPASFTGTCSLPTPDPVRVDTNGSVGQFTSLAIVNGNPAISYYDATNGDLMFVRATAADGSSWGAPARVDTAGIVGQYTSLAIVNGNPAISYYDNTNGDLKYARSADADGTNWTLRVSVDTTGDVGTSTSLAIVNGNPAIAYYDRTNGRLKYVRAANADGTAWAAPVIVDTIGTGVIPNNFSLLIVNGNPAIAYTDIANGDLKFVRASDADGAAWGLPAAVDTAGDVGRFVSMAIVSGNPAISYYDATNGDLKYARATNADGGAWAAPISVDTAGDVGRFTSLAVVNGNPAIAYEHVTSSDLKYVRATDADGASWGVPVGLDTVGTVGQNTSLRIVDGRPAISYYDVTNGDLKFVRPNPPAFSINWIALEP